MKKIYILPILMFANVVLGFFAPDLDEHKNENVKSMFPVTSNTQITNREEEQQAVKKQQENKSETSKKQQNTKISG